MNSSLFVVLLGADLNCYQLARSFYECYDVRPVVLGRHSLAQTAHSRILDFYAVKDLENPCVLEEILQEIALRTPQRKRIVMGCTDAYVLLLSELRTTLSNHYIVPYDTPEKLRRFADKERFLQLCRSAGIETPSTRIRYPYTPLPEVGFDYPIILKCADSARYWHHPFSNMHKVYLAQTPQQAQSILERIDRSGYDAPMLLQAYVAGADWDSYVLHGYSDRHGRVRSLSFGRVLCEEHTPRGRGNPCAVLTVPLAPICEKLRSLLEKERFVGFFNFDLKKDAQSGQWYVFECNVRQGRCSYFASVAGIDLAKSVVEERLQCVPYRGVALGQAGCYWRYLPDRLVQKMVPNVLFDCCRAAIKTGKAINPYDFAPDLHRNPARRIWLFLHRLHFWQKFRRHPALHSLATATAYTMSEEGLA